MSLKFLTPSKLLALLYKKQTLWLQHLEFLARAGWGLQETKGRGGKCHKEGKRWGHKAANQRQRLNRCGELEYGQNCPEKQG